VATARFAAVNADPIAGLRRFRRGGACEKQARLPLCARRELFLERVGERAQFVLDEQPGRGPKVDRVFAWWPSGRFEPLGGLFASVPMRISVFRGLTEGRDDGPSNELVPSRNSVTGGSAFEDQWLNSELSGLAQTLIGWTDRSQPLASAESLSPPASTWPPCCFSC
jgi:hypothetical protein